MISLERDRFIYINPSEKCPSEYDLSNKYSPTKYIYKILAELLSGVRLCVLIFCKRQWA